MVDIVDPILNKQDDGYSNMRRRDGKSDAQNDNKKCVSHLEISTTLKFSPICIVYTIIRESVLPSATEGLDNNALLEASLGIVQTIAQRNGKHHFGRNVERERRPDESLTS